MLTKETRIDAADEMMPLNLTLRDKTEKSSPNNTLYLCKHV